MLTPARTWAVAASDRAGPQASAADHDHAGEPVDRMAWPQRAAMLVTVAVPILGLIVAVVWLWHRRSGHWHVGWPEVVALLGMYALAGFGVTIGYHRLLTHKAFATYHPVKLALAVLGSSAGQGMTIRWVAIHRRHHQQADRPGDPHSPHLHGEGFSLRGLWYAHLGWTFDAEKPDLARSVTDLTADRGMLRVDQLYLLWVTIGLLVPAVVVGVYERSWTGFAAGLVWGGLVRICLMQHVTWSVNSVCHVFGRRPFHSSDHSTNNLPVALLSLGEGWHNNHHAFPTSARHGLRWWQFDPSYAIIVGLKQLGLAWDVRLPSAAAMASKANPGR